MAKLLRYIAARPWPFLSVLVLLSLLAGWQLPRLQIDMSPQSLSIEGDEAREFYRRTVDVFGGDNITILFFKDPDLFAPERLRAIRDLVAELQALPYVVRTESLFSLPNLRTDDDGYVHTEAYLAGIPETKNQAAAAEILHRELAGIETVTVVVDARIQGTFQKVRYLEQLQKIQHYLAQDRHFDTSLSLADYVAQLHSVVNETGEPELPQFDEALAELLMFVKHEHIRGYLSDDFSRATLVLRHSVGDSESLTRALAGLEVFAARTLDPGLEVRVTGDSVLSSRAADYITVGQIKSLGLMLLAIFVVIGLLFANVRAGLLAIVPNVFPIIILFGVMGYAGIPLDTGTALIAAIAVGICVDNTMHFMVRYNRELRRHRSEIAAIDATLRAEAMPITATSVSLALGFATMALSSFTPVVYFGLLSALVMLLAFYADFFITPVLLSSTRLLTLWDLLALNLRNDLQAMCALFEGMRPNQIKRIVLNGNLRQFRAGEKVMCQGEIGRELFVLLEGEGKLLFPTRNERLSEIRGLQRGDVFGVLAVVSQHPRCATVVATTDVKVLALDWLQIRAIARSCPYSTSLLFCNLTRLVSERYSLHISKDQGAEQIPSARQPLSARVFHESTTETRRTEHSRRAEVELETVSS